MDTIADFVSKDMRIAELEKQVKELLVYKERLDKIESDSLKMDRINNKGIISKLDVIDNLTKHCDEGYLPINDSTISHICELNIDTVKLYRSTK